MNQELWKLTSNLAYTALKKNMDIKFSNNLIVM